MAGHRAEKMASAIRDIVSDAIRNRLNDPRISPLSSITRVEMSSDLQIARVFVSVLGSEAESRRTAAGLTHAVGRIQRIVAKNLQTRHCPEIRVEMDESLKKAARTFKLIDETLGGARLEGDVAGTKDTSEGVQDDEIV